MDSFYGKSHCESHNASPGLLQWKIICLLKNFSVPLGLCRDVGLVHGTPMVVANCMCPLGQAVVPRCLVKHQSRCFSEGISFRCD